ARRLGPATPACTRRIRRFSSPRLRATNADDGGVRVESPGRASVERRELREEMRTVLTMCVLTGALLGPRHAGAAGILIGDRADQTDTGILEVSSDPPA